MKFYYLTIALIMTLTSCDQPTATSAEDAEQLSAAGSEPTTDRGIHVDTYFGTDVPDPYRWLEDDLSDDTSVWISQQNTSTRSFIDAISPCEAITEFKCEDTSLTDEFCCRKNEGGLSYSLWPLNYRWGLLPSLMIPQP